VIKELHDREISEISLGDLLERLRVGPLQQPASDLVAVDVETGRQALERLAERIRSGRLGVIPPEELAELRRPGTEVGAGDEPDLLAAEEEIEKLARYFEEVEERLTTLNDAPVHLVETQSARRVLFAISQFLDDEAERNRAWKHFDPSEVAQAFVDLVAAFVKERRLSWEDLANELHLEPRTFGRLRDLVSDENE
jgi:hypothetical protein